MGEPAVRTGDHPVRIGRHTVLGFLAQGGMSEIFLARDPTGRLVVIKRILPHLARQSSFVSMFIDEARIGSLIHHPNVVEVYELGQVGIDLFMVMEYLEGESASGLLRRLVGRNDRLPYALVAHIVAEACRGLHAAHVQIDESGKPLGLIHRDVSPQNVFLTYDGQVKVLDFGIATAAQRLAHTATGELKGKFSYMSPEQCRGEALDVRSDVFSLGVLLWELGTQRRLFSRTNELLVLKAVCDDPIPPPSRDAPDFPPFLEDICMKAMSRDKNQRYQDAGAMAVELAAALEMLIARDAEPRAALATELARLFDDRVLEKSRLASQARAGTDLGLIPSPEADQSVVVPAASQYTGTATGGTRLTALTRKRVPVMGAIAVALIAVAVAVAIPVMRGGADPERAVTPTIAAPVAPVHVPVFVPPAPPAPVPARTEVVVRVETRPPGATIVVDGDARGVTPTDLTLPIGAAPVTVVLRRRGFSTMEQVVAADRDQRLVFTLVPRARRPAKENDDGKGYFRFD
jgi:hypothetical protein